MLKREELDLLDSVLANTDDDEPIFILCARDCLAPKVIAEWIKLASFARVPVTKISEAVEHLGTFVDWQAANPDKVKMPD
jgi:hypothetical protein